MITTQGIVVGIVVAVLIGLLLISRIYVWIRPSYTNSSIQLNSTIVNADQTQQQHAIQQQQQQLLDNTHN